MTIHIPIITLKIYPIAIFNMKLEFISHILHV